MRRLLFLVVVVISLIAIASAETNLTISTCNASSVYKPCANAYDNSIADNDNNRWIASAGAVQWANFDLGSTKTIHNISIFGYNSGSQTYVINTSTDGGVGTTVLTAVTPGTNVWSNRTLSSDVNARFVRVVVTASSGWASLGEIDVFAAAVPATPISANFTSTPNPSEIDESVQFNDTSTGTPTTWNWTFNDGNTSALQNPTNAFPAAGVYSVNLNVTNSTGAFSDISFNQTVTNASIFTSQDVWQVGQYTRQFVITSSATGLPISGALVEAGGGTQNTSIANGSAWITEPFGSYSHTITATGYTGKVITLVYDSDAKTSIQLTPTTTSSNYNVKYPPKDIRFHVQTASGAPITLAYVQATPYHTPLGSYEYIASLFGYDLGTVPLDTLTMNGSTDSHGDISFAMMTDVQYYVTATKTGYTFTPLNITPHDDNYLITADHTGSLFVTNGTSPAASIRFNTSYTRVNQTTGFINLSVVDTAGSMTGGTMNITQKNTTALNSTTPVQIASVVFTGNISRANFTLFDGTTSGCPASTGTIYNTTGAVVGCMNKTLVDDASYQTGCKANTPTGAVYEVGTVWFKKMASPIAGLSPEFALFIALSIMMFTALMAGTSTAGPVALVVTFEGWVMYGMNMFVLMEGSTKSGLPIVPAALTVMTFITIVYLFVDYRRKGK